MLLVPLFEALVLPGIVERANNAEASRRICYTSKVDALAPNRTKYTYPQRHLLFAAFLTIPKKFTRFRRVKKERRVNAISLCFADPPRIARDRASAMRSAIANLIQIFNITKKYAEKHKGRECHRQLRELPMALNWDYCHMWKPPLRCLPRRLARHASRACLGVSSGCIALNSGNVSASPPDTEQPPSSGAGGC